MRRHISALALLFGGLSAAPIQAAPYIPVPAPKPLIGEMPKLSVEEIDAHLEISPALIGWDIGKNDVYYYACSNKFNLQVVMPLSYRFDFEQGATPADRLAVAAKTDAVITDILKLVVRNNFPYALQTKKPRVDVPYILSTYEDFTFRQGQAIDIADYAGIVVARGCGGIEDQDAYNDALKNASKIMRLGYL